MQLLLIGPVAIPQTSKGHRTIQLEPLTSLPCCTWQIAFTCSSPQLPLSGSPLSGWMQMRLKAQSPQNADALGNQGEIACAADGLRQALSLQLRLTSRCSFS